VKALAGSLGIIASVVSIIATLVRLRWNKVKEAPGPTPPQTETQVFIRKAAAVWLLLMAGIITFVVVLLFLPPIIQMFMS
jgi:hypothetical protein